MPRLNSCRFCDHHYIDHIYNMIKKPMPDCEWKEGPCHFPDCICKEYGDADNLKFLEEKYERNSL